jgi:hypothetical protein
LPIEVRSWLVARAKGNERSMNSEIIAILKELMKAPARPKPGDGGEGRDEIGGDL